MCALLLMKRRRRRRSQDRVDEKLAKMMMKEHADSQAVGGDFDWEDWDNATFVGDENTVTTDGVEIIGGGADGEIVLHVGNVSPLTSADRIRELFEQHGTVNNCIIPQDHKRNIDIDSYSNERFALLTMPWTSDESDRTDVRNACAHVHGLEVDGQVLNVKEVTTLHVGNLSPEATEEDVRDLFLQYGTVTSCIVPQDHHPNGGAVAADSSKRFALVTMPTDEASNAMNHLHDIELDGHVITVRDMKYMRGGHGNPGGFAAATLAAGAMGAIAAFHRRRENDEVTLHVGNLGPYTAEEDIRDLFEEHGTVIECVVISDNEDDEEGGNSRYALVTMPADDAKNATDCIDGMELYGHQLTVRDAYPGGNGGAGISGRNLMDDASSTSGYDNHSSRRAGNKSAGVMAAMGAVGGCLAAPFLLRPCKKKGKNTGSEDDDNQFAHLESITGRYYGAHDSPDDAEKSLDDGLDNIINNIDNATDAQDRRNFVVDPPGAFHLGNHHYTSDGVRYFSPLCELCIAARADADGVVALDAINQEDDEEEDDDGSKSSRTGLHSGDLSFDLEATKKFTDFNANDLGRYHSSMHVRHCKSTTCDLCRREKGVFFVKSRESAITTAASTRPREAML